MTSLDVLRTITNKDNFYKIRTCEDADWRFGSYLLLEYLISTGKLTSRDVPFISKISSRGKLLPKTISLTSSYDTPLTVSAIQKNYYVPTYLALDTYPGVIIDSNGENLRRPMLATPRGDIRSVHKLKWDFEQELGIDPTKSDWFVSGIMTLLSNLVDGNIDLVGLEETMWAGDQMIAR